MKDGFHSKSPYPRASNGARAAKLHPDSPQTRSSSYKLAYQDEEFLIRDELRPVRLQLELLKPELIQQEQAIESTIVIFGGSRITDYNRAKKEFDFIKAKADKNPEDLNLFQYVESAEEAWEIIRAENKIR